MRQSARITYLHYLLTMVLAASLSSCSYVTELIPMEADRYLGETYASQIRTEVNGDPVLDSVAYVDAYAHLYGIVDKIKQSPEIRYRDFFPYSIKIVQNDSIINAFCIPGGYIYVYTGLIHFLESDAELAGVLAHEIAHAECRHSMHRLVTSQLLRLGVLWYFGSDPGIFVTIAENLLQLSFSRTDETEADTYAVKYLNQTPYHPLGIQGFFEKMKAKEKNPAFTAFLSTHPTSEDRYAHIEKIWRETGSKSGDYGKASYARLKKSLTKKW